MTTERIPLCDLRAQYTQLAPEIIGAIAEVLAEQRFVLGDRVARFEGQLGELAGATHAVGVASGSDALYLALRALGIGQGDGVLVPAYTFFATAGAVARTGATPLFCDVDPVTMVAGAAELVARARGVDAKLRLRAVVPVHLFGQCAPMAEIMAFARSRDLVVVEDVAQALGASDGDGRAGTFGAASALSFFPSKNLGAYGDGGAVLTPLPEVAARVKALRAHGAGEDGLHHEVGINSRLDAVQAAILSVKATHLARWNEGRRRAAERYRALVAEQPWHGRIELPAVRPGTTHVFHQFVIKLDDREALAAHLASRGIASRAYYPVPLHREPCFSSQADLALPCAERCSRTALALPMFPEITEAQQREVVSAIAELFG